MNKPEHSRPARPTGDGVEADGSQLRSLLWTKELSAVEVDRLIATTAGSLCAGR